MKHTTPDLMKFKKLQRRLGTSKVMLMGMLEALWITTQKSAPRGDIGKFDNEEIAIEMEWDGDPDILVNSLVECGWLDKCPEHRLVVHDWCEHAPNYVKGVVKRQGGFVSPSSEPKVSDQDRSSSQPRVDNPGLPTQGGQQRNLTQRNLTQPNEEEGTEEATPTSEPAPDPPPPMTEFEFPVNGSKKIKTWQLPVDLFEDLAEAYPGVDTVMELRNVLVWAKTNPRKRKTYDGMPAFLRNWFKKAQNECSRSPPTRDQPGNIDDILNA